MSLTTNRIRTGMALATALLATIACLGTAQRVVENLDLLYEVTLPEAPLYVYYTAGIELSIDDALSIGFTLAEYAGEPFLFDDYIGPDESGRLFVLGARDPSALFEINLLSHDFLFSAGLGEYQEPGDTPGLVGQGEAPQVALDHLATVGLFAPEEQLLLVDIGGLAMAEYEGGGNFTAYAKLVSVRFARVLGGLVVNGNSRLSVDLGAYGELVNIAWALADVDGQRLGQRDTRDISDIRDELVDRVMVDVAASNAWVDSVDLVLYDDGLGIIEPAFYVQVMFEYEDGTVQLYDYYVPVMRNSIALYPSLWEGPDSSEPAL